MDEQHAQSGSEPKKLVVPRRERVLAETSQGQMFARGIIVKDLKTFDKYVSKNSTVTDADYEDIGNLALLTLVIKEDSADYTPALTPEMLARLSPGDLTILTRAVAKACRLSTESSINTVSDLGKVLLESLAVTARQIAESSAAIKESIGNNFGSLSRTLQVSLGDKFSALSAIRNALGSTSAVSAAMQEQERSRAILGGALGNIGLPGGDTRKTIEPPVIRNFHPPRFEETAPGRAAARAVSASEESARQLTEVAGIMGTMADQMAGLQTVFLSQVLPEWFKNLEEGGEATRTTLRQAETSLLWAKWALIASVIVSVAMTGWQVWLAREYKLENDKQQETSELLMRKQLKALEDMQKQLATATQATPHPAVALGKSAAMAPEKPVQNRNVLPSKLQR